MRQRSSWGLLAVVNELHRRERQTSLLSFAALNRQAKHLYGVTAIKILGTGLLCMPLHAWLR